VSIQLLHCTSSKHGRVHSSYCRACLAAQRTSCWHCRTGCARRARGLRPPYKCCNIDYMLTSAHSRYNMKVTARKDPSWPTAAVPNSCRVPILRLICCTRALHVCDRHQLPSHRHNPAACGITNSECATQQCCSRLHTCYSDTACLSARVLLLLVHALALFAIHAPFLTR
jgi:hypothetical protein